MAARPSSWSAFQRLGRSSRALSRATTSPPASRRTRPGPRPLPPSGACGRGPRRGRRRSAGRSRPRRSASAVALVSAIAAGPFSQQATHHLLAGGGKALRRHHLVDQADALRLGGAEPLAGERVAAQLPHRDGVAELGNDDGGRQPPAHLRDRERRRCRRRSPRRRRRRCRCRRRSSRPAPAPPSARGSRFRRSTASAVARLAWTFSSCEARGDRAHPCQVGAGLEVLAVAPEQHHAQLGPSGERVHGRQQALDQLAVVGVAHLGPVERHGGDAALIEAVQYGCAAHAIGSTSRLRRQGAGRSAGILPPRSGRA